MPVHEKRGRFRLDVWDPKSRKWEPHAWYETREELDAAAAFMKSCPIDDGPIELRAIEYGVKKVERL